MKRELLCTLQESALQHAADNTRNKHIKDSYGMVVTRISNLIEMDVNRAWNKFPRLEKAQIIAPNTIEEFYTPYCSVKLVVKRMNYVILLMVTDQSFQAGHRVNSTALLRIAFETTQHNINGFKIDNCLEIAVDNNIATIYKQKYEEMVNRQNLAYFNKKMKIEG